MDVLSYLEDDFLYLRDINTPLLSARLLVVISWSFDSVVMVEKKFAAIKRCSNLSYANLPGRYQAV
jgi:hypothetical protein